MPKKTPVLGHAVDGGEEIVINIEELIGSDICIVANKGAGKSGMVRVLCEQTQGLIQQVILDPEGEFYTLRETGDYLIAGGTEAGDCPATATNAASLARTLMENPGISAIIQLDHLKPWEQETFVGLFLEEMMETPKKFWHPLLLVIDETQRFAPQEGTVASTAAMKDVIGRGRKRGITPVFATYRVAAIDKNVTAGSPTWFMGRVGQDIDRRSAASAMGFTPSSEDAKNLPFLPKRRFWTYGAATTPRPTLFDVSQAQTTMVKAGQTWAPMPPAPKSLQKLLQALSKAAAPETPAIPAPSTGAAPLPDLDAIRAQAKADGVLEGAISGHDHGITTILERLEDWIADQRAGLSDINVGVDDLDLPRQANFGGAHDLAPTVRSTAVHMSMDRPVDTGFVKRAIEKGAAVLEKKARKAAARADGELSEAAQSLIAAARQAHRPVSWDEAAWMAGRIPQGGSYNTIRKELRDAGWEQPPSNDLAEEGLFMPVDEIRRRVASGFTGPVLQVFQLLWDAGPHTKIQIAEATGRVPQGGSWNSIWATLRKSPRVQQRDDRWDVAPTLRELADLPRA